MKDREPRTPRSIVRATAIIGATLFSVIFASEEQSDIPIKTNQGLNNTVHASQRLSRSLPQQNENQEEDFSIEPAVKWERNNIPLAISIPSISYFTTVSPLEDLDPGSGYKYETPAFEMGTPKEPPENIIYGIQHSSSGGEVQKAAKIADLNDQDVIFVWNENKDVFVFNVVGFKLLNRDKEQILPWEYEENTLLLQISAANANEPGTKRKWFIDPNSLSKTNGNLPEDPSGNLVLLVIARPANHGKAIFKGQ